jgi:hypothetical protein
LHSTTTQVVTPVLADFETSPSIAIGQDGRPLIAYHEEGSEALWVARCDDLQCKTATSHRLNHFAPSCDVFCIPAGAVKALIGADGLLLVVDDHATGDPASNPFTQVAYHCDDPDCSSVVHVIIDATHTLTSLGSIALTPSGKPIVSYQNVHDGSLLVTTCGNVYCSPYQWAGRH